MRLPRPRMTQDRLTPNQTTQEAAALQRISEAMQGGMVGAGLIHPGVTVALAAWNPVTEPEEVEYQPPGIMRPQPGTMQLYEAQIMMIYPKNAPMPGTVEEYGGTVRGPALIPYKGTKKPTRRSRAARKKAKARQEGKRP